MILHQININRLAVVMMAVLWLPGCGGSNATVERPEAVEAESIEIESAEAPPASETPAAEAGPLVKEPPTVVESRERLMLLLPDGPVICDLVFKTNDADATTTWSQAAAQVIASADDDQDGATSWEELLGDDLLLALLGGQRQNVDDMQSLAESYDVDSDGSVAPSELFAFLSRGQTRNGGLTLVSTNFRAANSYAAAASLPVLKWLDADDDGYLSGTEISTADKRLFKRDGDNNLQLRLDEFETSAESGMMYRPASQRATQLVQHLTPKTNWSRLKFELEESYAYNNPVSAADVPGSERWFRLLDVNEDDAIGRDELEFTCDIPSDWTLEVDLTNIAQPFRVSARRLDQPIDLQSTPTEVQADSLRATFDETAVNIQRPLVETVLSIQERLNPLTDADSHSSLVSAPTDAEPATAASDQAEEESVKEQGEEAPPTVGVTVAQGAAQLGVPAEVLQRFDADENDQLSATEAKVFSDFMMNAVNCRLVVRIDYAENRVFSILDQNGDGKLDSREIQAAPQTLQAADRNEDGQIATAELPQELQIFVGQRTPPMELFRRQPQQPAENGDWFHQMDVNRDGEIAASEFLGSIDQFQRLDENQDGYVSAAESNAAANQGDGE